MRLQPCEEKCILLESLGLSRQLIKISFVSKSALYLNLTFKYQQFDIAHARSSYKIFISETLPGRKEYCFLLHHFFESRSEPLLLSLFQSMLQ